MDRLFTPWRMAYVAGETGVDAGCVFCRIAQAPDRDEEALVVHRGLHHVIVLNLFPYTTGHLLIVPFAHRERLAELEPGTLVELTQLAVVVERLLTATYHPEGINFGMNLGRCAGAGIEEHLHLHAVPRWRGDTSFMTVTSATRVLPEDLRRTWTRLRERLPEVLTDD